MTKYREILRLNSLGVSGRSIAASCACSRNTVSKVLKRAQELNVTWPLKEGIPDSELHQILFPEFTQPSLRKRPDYDYILDFSMWEEIFGDHMVAAALVDRITFKSHILNMNAESYRLKQR